MRKTSCNLSAWIACTIRAVAIRAIKVHGRWKLIESTEKARTKEKEKEKGSSVKEVKDKTVIPLEKVEAEEVIIKDAGATEKGAEEAPSPRKEQEQLGNMATARVKVKERIRKEHRSLKELATTVAKLDTKHQSAIIRKCEVLMKFKKIGMQQQHHLRSKHRKEVIREL